MYQSRVYYPRRRYRRSYNTYRKPWLNTFKRYVRRFRYSAPYTGRQLGLPATRGYRSVYGPYKRSQKELKGIETANAGIPTATPSVANAGIFLLNGVAQGDDYNNRIGREVTFRSIYVRAQNYLNVTTPTPVTLRWLIFWDKQTNGANIVFTDVLNDLGSTAAAVDDTSMNNLTNRDRFVIVYDKVIDMNPGNTAEQYFKFMKKYRSCNVKTVYSGTGNTVAAIQTNALWLMVISNQPVGSGVLPNMNIRVRLRFEDC